MAKKTRIEDIDSEAVINSFRLDDTSIPPEARSTGGNAPSPPPKEELQTVITSPASRPKEEPERKRRNGKPEKQDYDTVFMCGSNVTARLGKQVYIRKEYHDRIQKMLHVIGGNEVTIAAFLDNVLTPASAAKCTTDYDQENTGVDFRKDKGRDKPLSTFLQASEIKTRQCIYISREIHEKVAIVTSRMGNGLSIGKFVDNILRDHFRQYGQQYMEQIENAQKVRL